MEKRQFFLLLLAFFFLGSSLWAAGCGSTVNGVSEEGNEGKENTENEIRGVITREGPVVGLALSGGGGLGMAHIGVIDVLVEHGIPIDIITGTSAGAIVGALFCDGISPEQMEKIVSEISWSDFLVASVPELGFFSTEGIEEKLKEHLQSENFEDLAIPLAVIATNLDDGEEIVINRGSIVKGVAASAAIPVIFKPVEYEGMILVDGGLVNNLPSDLAREMGADIVIAVNLADNFRFEGRPQGLIETGIRSYNILQRSHSIRVDADIEIHPDLEGVAGTDLDQYREIIYRGREAAEEVVPDILALLGEKRKKEQ